MNSQKICEQCNQPRNVPEDFSVRKKSGYVPKICKYCERDNARDNRRKRYQDKTERKKIQAQNKRYGDEHREELNKKFRDKYAEDDKLKNQIKKNTKKWRKKHPDRNRKQHAAQYQKDKPKLRARWNSRYRSDSAFRLRNNLRRAIHEALRHWGGNKAGRSILKYLPYTMEQLKSHLESQWEPWMTWDNYGPLRIGQRTWQVDHIIPQDKLPYTDFSDSNFQICWALSNLRPLDSALNISRGCRP